jgi:uncharacterized membrane protein YdbT with pleckstrin-like domain
MDTIVKIFLYQVIGTIIMATLLYFYAVFSKELKGMSFIEMVAIVGVFQLFIFFVTLLRKINFQYEFGDKNIVLKQGVVSRSERQIFYGRIQNVNMDQDFIDKFLSLATLVIMTASDSGGVTSANTPPKIISRKRGAASLLDKFAVGFHSNSITVPGLSYKNALELKNLLMEQIKTNPIDDAQSGL